MKKRIHSTGLRQFGEDRFPRLICLSSMTSTIWGRHITCCPMLWNSQAASRGKAIQSQRLLRGKGGEREEEEGREERNGYLLNPYYMFKKLWPIPYNLTGLSRAPSHRWKILAPEKMTNNRLVKDVSVISKTFLDHETTSSQSVGPNQQQKGHLGT